MNEFSRATELHKLIPAKLRPLSELACRPGSGRDGVGPRCEYGDAGFHGEES